MGVSHVIGVEIIGSFLLDYESNSDYILKKSTPLMAQSMLVAPFMNGKDFAFVPLSGKAFVVIC